ncbi:MAG TPA: DUF2089 domain-containing protein [Anaerolineales bacterium]|nr:DUF2089 domain-containing protein [Anaerolineales bacterium]
MHNLPAQCPLCGGEVLVTKFACRECETAFEGRFVPVAPVTAFASLTPEQLSFVEIFVRCEGKINRVEKELNLSYPTIRNRLREVIQAMGYQPEEDAPASIPSQARQEILDALDRGEISFEDAMQQLKGGDL